MVKGRISAWCMLVYIIILLALTKDIAETHEINHPAPEFSRHSIAQPTVHHARTRREITSTRDMNGIHHREVTVIVDVDGEEYVLDLQLNEDLVTGDHTISYMENGKRIQHKPRKEELDICQYSGTVRGKKDSWVAVSTCHGLRGIINDGTRIFYIEPAHANIESKHYVYSHSDLNTQFDCGFPGVTNNTKFNPDLLKENLDKEKRARSRTSRYKRDTSDDTMVRGPFNANKRSRYVELVLVADHREYIANGESRDMVHHQLKDVANIINSVFSSLNIFIALVGVVVWTEGDEIVLEEDGDKTLDHFLEYRRTKLLQQIPNDNAHLLTRQKFSEGKVVGKAFKGSICTYESSGGVSTDHSEVIGLVATTIAHEMGHNFGMDHDTEVDCDCPDKQCIMGPSSTSVVPLHWSSCSLLSLALSFERDMDYCLRNKPKRLFMSPTCGNGFVEPGEQCDCGLDGSAACRACCHPSTCLLRSNATCAVGECCDPQTCRPKSPGTVCRSADKECDLPEFCTGHSEFCPTDVFKMDATPCSNNQAYCVQGSCRTRNDQCRLLWGFTGTDSDRHCYVSNLKGNVNGNCGYSRSDPPQYVRCAQEHALCGLLQCRHLNEQLEFGTKSVARQGEVYMPNNGAIIRCHTVMIDLGLNVPDPGMVPNGAPCGDDKMCLNQRCVPVQMVVERISKKEGSVCPSNCSGHGVCNSEGHCHCEPGFAPPLCAGPGPGGSYDSGPATDSSVQRKFMVAMYVIFLGILPSVLLVLFLLYCTKHNVPIWWKKPRKTYVFSLCSNGIWKSGTNNFNINITNMFSLSYIRKLLDFKQKGPNCEAKDVKDENDDVSNHSIKDDLSKKGEKPNRFERIQVKNREVPIKNIKREIKKEDIKIAIDCTELSHTDKLTIANKPAPRKETKINKSIEIVNTGLSFTTNENIKDMKAETIKTNDVVNSYNSKGEKNNENKIALINLNKNIQQDKIRNNIKVRQDLNNVPSTMKLNKIINNTNTKDAKVDKTKNLQVNKLIHKFENKL